MKQLDYKEELIAQLKKGDRQAQYTFYKTYADAMYNICLRMLSDHWEAENVLQKSFMDAYTHIDRYNFKATPGAWLKRITVNNCIDLIRKNRHETLELKEDIVQVVHHEENMPEVNMRLIKEGIEQLSEGYKIVLSLYLFEGYDHREISRILDISESTSKSQYHRGRQRLIQFLNQHQSKLYQ